ncbi:MAG: segregation/condensation protein A [bacterium]
MYHLQLEKFEGPFDLLLQLIEQDKLNISEISLAEIADQYVQYIDLNKDKINANDLSDFLLIAAKLLLIKSRYLMPFLETDNDDEDEGSLENQLKIYKEFLEASKKINACYESKNTAFFRPVFLQTREISFYPPKNITTNGLKEAFCDLLARLKPYFKIDEERFERRITVQEKLDEIKQMLLNRIEFGFSNLLGSREKSEIIVSFLAILELVKQKYVFVDQEGHFEEIIITRTI